MPDDEEPNGRDDEREDRPADDQDGGEDRQADDQDSGRLDEVRALAETDAERLRRGSAISFFGAPLPVRTLIALAVFVVVFLLVWSALWASGGGLGLGLGWIPAAAVAALAVAFLSRTVWSDSTGDRTTTPSDASRA